MKNELRALTKILLGEEELSYSIYNDTEKIDTAARKFNTLLDIQPNSKDDLRSTHRSKTVISPLPFYGVNNQQELDLVFLSLTPRYEDSRIHTEKQAAGENWREYFDFYTSNKYFDFVKEQNLSYFMNVSKIIFALNETHDQGMISIEDIEKKLSVEKVQILETLLKDKSVLFPHIVPFHSEGFETNMNGINHLKESLPSYNDYLNALMILIKTNLKADGMVICNGFSDSKIMSQLILADDGVSLVDNQLLSVLKWDTKYAVLFNDQPFTRYGLRSDVELDKVMSYVADHSDENIQALDTYCKTLLEQRTEEDFKVRGERIKGSQLKKVSVKKLRKR